MTDLRHVLLAEDDPDISSLVKLSLEEFGGLAVTHFASGQAALEAVKDIAPDMIILDYRMPGMNGREVMERLKCDESTRGIPVVFMTASVMPAHVQQLLELGAVAVIAKPFNPLSLPDRLQEIWQELFPSRS